MKKKFYAALAAFLLLLSASAIALIFVFLLNLTRDSVDEKQQVHLVRSVPD